MKYPFLTLTLILIVLMSCDKKESTEFYVIDGEFENYEGDIYLSPAIDTAYYSNNFREDTARVIDGKFKFKLSKKLNTPLPFHIRTENLITDYFNLDPKNHQVRIDELNGSIKPTFLCENPIIHNEDKVLAERRKSPREVMISTIENIYNSNFSNDSIQKLAAIAQEAYKEKSLLILKQFSKDYPQSYVSFWFLARSQMYFGYDINMEYAYENISSEIKESAVGIIFEEKLLMSKISQTGTSFPSFESK